MIANVSLQWLKPSFSMRFYRKQSIDGIMGPLIPISSDFKGIEGTQSSDFFTWNDRYRSILSEYVLKLKI